MVWADPWNREEGEEEARGLKPGLEVERSLGLGPALVWPQEQGLESFQEQGLG